MLGVRQALTICSGTGALNCVMHGFDISPGDEVLVTPYTFHTGASIPLMNYALPIFVDIDAESLQMDPALIEERVSGDTRAAIVCHWGGQAADMDGIIAAARKHSFPVCEDAYQALTGRWRGKPLGTVADIGVIGHHENEILPCGEGATLVSNDDTLMSRCYTWHDFGRDWVPETHRLAGGPYGRTGRNMKVMDVHGAVLLAGLHRLNEISRIRRDNVATLKRLLRDVRGIATQKEYAGQDQGGYSQFLFRYEPGHFSDVPLATFLRAVKAEGMPIAGSLGRPVSRESYIEATLASPRFQKLYSRTRLDRARDSLHCPRAERACQTTLSLHGRYLQGTTADMEMVAESIRKVQKRSSELAKRGAA